MECNKDEAMKAKEIAEKKFQEKDIMGARKFAMKAQNLFPALDGIEPFLSTLNIYISAERKLNGEIDWYGVLGIDPSSDDETVKKQYRKLALALHPDKNKSVGADGAFKILSEAWSLLSDKARRAAYDHKRKSRGTYQNVMQKSTPSNQGGKNGVRKSANNGNFNVRSMNSPNPHSVHAAPPLRGTFWTLCTSCNMQFEYQLCYLDKKLQCYSCKEPFVAARISPPQTNIHQRWSPHIQRQNSTYSTSTVHTGGVGSAPASAPSAVQTRNGTQLPHEKLNRMHGDARVSATLEHAIKSRANAFKRTFTSEANPCVTGKVENPKKSRQTYEQIEKSDQMTCGSEGAGFGSSSGVPRGISETQKTSVGIMWQFPRELSLLATRNMLMAKAKIGIQKKLDEWKTRDDASAGNTTVNGVERNLDKKPEISSLTRSSVDDETQDSNSASVTMTVPDPDFYDFDKYRSENSFGDNQVWAAYDNDDGMPRYYAMIHNVVSRKPFKMRISWLNSKSTAEFGPMNWVGSGFYKTSGDFRVGKHEINKSVNSFSHRVKWAKGPRGAIRIYPCKGDIWALYKNWSPEWNEHTSDDIIHQYDMVEVLDEYNEDTGVTVIPLVKVAGFKTLFRQHIDKRQARIIPREEMFRFSHLVPSCLLTGMESSNAPKGCWELDPAATPLELLQVVAE